jgi:hypothetical protein
LPSNSQLCLDFSLENNLKVTKHVLHFQNDTIFMSDTAMFGRAAASLGGIPHGCQVLILAEDFTAYNRAMHVCRRIMDQMGQEADFDFRCWNFSELTDPECAHSATKYAATADMVIISTQAAILPAPLDNWFETLHQARVRPAGVLALILNKPAREAEIQKLVNRMEAVAMRGVMDFLPLLPPVNEHTEWQPQSPENWDMMHGRPETDTPPDDRWGLSE